MNTNCVADDFYRLSQQCVQTVIRMQSQIHFVELSMCVYQVTRTFFNHFLCWGNVWQLRTHRCTHIHIQNLVNHDIFLTIVNCTSLWKYLYNSMNTNDKRKLRFQCLIIKIFFCFFLSFLFDRSPSIGAR